MDIKRILLWAIFTLSALMLYDNWQRDHGRPSMFFQNPPSQTAAGTASAPKSDIPTAATSAQTAVAPAGASAVPATAAAATGEKITITTDLYKAQIDTLGGGVTHLELLKHLDGDKPLVLFERDAAHTYMARSGLIGASEMPNHNVVFAAEPGSRDLGNSNQVNLVLTADKGGAKLTKTYTFKKDSYVIDVKFDVQNTGAQAINPTLYMELARDGEKVEQSKFYSTFTGPAVYSESEKYQKIDFEDIAKGKAKFAPSMDANQPGWIAMVQHYFASAWIPETKIRREVYADKVDKDVYRVGLKEALGTIAPGAQLSTTARLFAGPQEEKNLETIAPGLELVKDYGWLAVIAKPLFWLLEKIHGFLGNWGWAIIALTVLIKLVFFPLSAASYKSMAKMKELQPRMTALKERFKGDPQKLNQAMMEMYKTEKVNPMGGCLPIVIQIPVFIALYWVLLSTVEMRNAPWIGWIHNLSAPDPYYILPVLMAVSMFIQTKLNPTPPDPVQAKVMLFMPLVFSVMFFFFPAGLVLYWVVNNVLSIAQQWSINRMLGKPKESSSK